MGRKSLKLLGVALFVLGLPIWAMADSISPVTFSGSGPTGASYTVNKTVTVNAGTPTTTPVDLFFLCDTTGSMGGIINTVKTNASAIMTSVSSTFGGNVAFGVGEYKDRTTAGDAFDYRLNQTITTNTALVQAGINAWSAGGGGDTPEQNLYALSQVATSATTGWRAGSAKLVVWFGDAPSHDPSGSSPEPTPRPVTLAGTITNLTGANVKVAAVNLSGLDSTGQATAIKNATGGALYSGVPTPADIVAIINGLIGDIFATYHTVSIDTSGVPLGVGVSVTPGSYVGTYDRSIDRTFAFSVTFTDLELGTHTFDIYATVDGARVATERDSITSTSAGVPEPTIILLLGSGFIALAGLRRKIKK
jgi:hypothetical protein